MVELRVALVTGANRGIGLEISRQLARRGLIVVMGARDPAKERTAVAALAADKLSAASVLLDVADSASIGYAVAAIDGRYGRLDVLVNNAAILIDGPGGFQASLFELTAETLRRTFETNVLGPMRLTQAIVPLMRRNGYGRVVNLSSGAGQLADMRMGFPAYRISKSSLNALTRITAAEVKADPIKVNAVCPGWVRTEMGGPNADRSVEKGAETPVWLATLPDDGPSGGFFRDMHPIPW
ncbi:MAG: SDR family oxidoreductase [Hyphomicrobium sp.]